MLETLPYSWFLLACFAVMLGLVAGIERKQIGFWPALAVLVCLLAAVAVRCARERAVRPHHVVISCSGRVLSDFWTTNREHYLYDSRPVMSHGVVTTELYRKTNYWW